MRRRIPASVLPLLLLTAAAAVWLLLDRGGRPAGGEATLLGLPPSAEVVELSVRSAASLVVLRREEGRWDLAGDLRDLVDQAEAAALVERVRLTDAVPVPEAAPGAEYGLERPLLLLTATDAEGRSAEVRIGDLNPVARRHYATAADGRIVTVPADLVGSLAALPGPLRLRRLWPAFAAAEVETLRLISPGLPGPDLLARDAGGRWWLREPADGARRLPPAALQYRLIYGDRTVERDGVTWWRADDLAPEVLLDRLEASVVDDFGPADAPPDSLRAAGLRPPTVAVAAVVGGRTLRAAFGRELPRGDAYATRQGLPNLLRVSREPRTAALVPLAAYLDLLALDFPVAAADSLRLERQDAAPITIRRRGSGWSVPGAADPADAADLAADLVHHLDRLRLQEPLPPEVGGRSLTPQHLTTVRVWLPDDVAGGGGQRLVRLGYLPGDRAALHEPTTGRLLLVPQQIMVTLRSVITGLERQRR